MKQTEEEYILACMELIFYAPYGTKITEREDGTLFIDGYLNLNGCKALTSLPESLSVGGSLNLDGCTALTSLPDSLKVRWHLNIGGCTSLTSLPDNLEVGDNLYLEGCTLYPFDESKYDVYEDYKIIPNSIQFIMED